MAGKRSIDGVCLHVALTKDTLNYVAVSCRVILMPDANLPHRRRSAFANYTASVRCCSLRVNLMAMAMERTKPRVSMTSTEDCHEIDDSGISAGVACCVAQGAVVFILTAVSFVGSRTCVPSVKWAGTTVTLSLPPAALVASTNNRQASSAEPAADRIVVISAVDYVDPHPRSIERWEFVYLLGSYRNDTAPELNSRRLMSFKSTYLDSPANNEGPWPASLG